MKRLFVALAAVAGACQASAIPAFAAPECSMSATLANWGEKAAGYITLAPKETCQFPLKFSGTIASSEISNKPDRGKLKKINNSTYQYTAKAKGTDKFTLTVSGRDDKGSGTSTMSVEVTVK